MSEQSGIDSHRIRKGEINESEFSNIVKTQNLIQETPFYIDDTPALSVSQMASRARRLKRTEGLKLIVIDYIQLIQSKSPRGPEFRVQEVSAITRQLKGLAKELNIPILALSQLSRALLNCDSAKIGIFNSFARPLSCLVIAETSCTLNSGPRGLLD